MADGIDYEFNEIKCSERDHSLKQNENCIENGPFPVGLPDELEGAVYAEGVGDFGFDGEGGSQSGLMYNFIFGEDGCLYIFYHLYGDNNLHVCS